MQVFRTCSIKKSVPLIPATGYGCKPYFTSQGRRHTIKRPVAAYGPLKGGPKDKVRVMQPDECFCFPETCYQTGRDNGMARPDSASR